MLAFKCLPLKTGCKDMKKNGVELNAGYQHYK